MKIYGYAKDGDELQELAETTVQSEPEQLRKLAGFFTKMADALETDRKNFGHGHAQDYCEDWSDDDPEIIIFKPNS